jgi:hypothetical protein
MNFITLTVRPDNIQPLLLLHIIYNQSPYILVQTILITFVWRFAITIT